MYERCLNEAERILAMDKDVIVPVKKVWQEVVKQGKGQGFEVPSLADFETMLEADPRFEFMPSQRELFEEEDGLSEEERAEEEAEMERLGFYSGDRIKLKRVELTPELLGGIIRRKVDRTMEALTKAWEMRPQDDKDTEDQLLDILARTQKLQREVKEAFSEERMAAVAKTIKKKNSPKRTATKTNRKAAAKKTTVSRKQSSRGNSSKKPRRGSAR
ncbi:MAG TPA: hypothetical protein VNN76_08530 [Bacteroidota bacterium]|nr:hypothetical protein [Bacteroidota bacterium]